MISEEKLIHQSQNGDSEAFGQLIRRYEDKIYRLAQSVCAKAPQEAEGVAQDTFLTAFKKIGKFQERSSLGTWLYRITSNLCWMRLRKKKREPVVSLETQAQQAQALEDLFNDPAKEASKRQLQQAVREALEALPMEYCLVVVLRDIQGMSAPETAKMLKLSVPAIKSRLHRGRLMLRNRLESF
jgi:RNA polymerase sigma-70 factor, ECF subfamily